MANRITPTLIKLNLCAGIEKLASGDDWLTVYLHSVCSLLSMIKLKRWLRHWSLKTTIIFVARSEDQTFDRCKHGLFPLRLNCCCAFWVLGQRKPCSKIYLKNQICRPIFRGKVLKLRSSMGSGISKSPIIMLDTSQSWCCETWTVLTIDIYLKTNIKSSKITLFYLITLFFSFKK